ncbi:STAS domain-containing protein [Hamadaea tsunoensis]|uniref:STAS domain-containing protein n=1 Tax=Hamadaea tsunoensis TaxID=53368 RepID=UPI000420DACF|nr:STAS domain-containing protein [Hamadaea tsunoensis]
MDSPEDFEIARVAEPEHVLVTVRGDVDLTTADQLGRQLEAAAEEDRDVVVDLAGVTFLDSTGVRTLVDAYRAGRRRGLFVSISGARDWVARMLEVTGVAGLMATRMRPEMPAYRPDHPGLRPPLG